jgi:hypothetical protein
MIFKKKHPLLVQAEKEYKIFQEEMDYQNELLKEAHLAKARFKADKDVTSAIATFERLHAKGLISSCGELYLADLYMKAGKNDKAWGFLNALIMQKNGPEKHKIRYSQAKLLKKEKRHKDAIIHYGMYHVDKCGEFNNSLFQKDIGVSAKSLKLTSSDTEALANITRSSKSEAELAKRYRKFFEGKGL